MSASAARPTAAKISAFVVSAVSDAVDATPYTCTELVRAVTDLVRWYVATAAQPALVRDQVFGRDVIVEHVATGLARYGQATRTNRRSQLLRVAESLLAPELAPRALPAMAPSDPTVPYTGDEETILTDWAKAEKRKGHGSDALVLLALGFGAGLSATEIMTVRAGDVAVRDEAVVVIVREGRVREVTVLRKWERALAKRAGELEPEEFLFKPGRAGGSKNLISNFVTRANVQGVHAQTQRMRSTWLVLHMGAGTSLVDLVDAAGVDSLEALTRYLQFVRRVSSAEAAKQLRSAA